LIDGENDKTKIQHIPENRTEYYDTMDKKMCMPSVDENGMTSWLTIEAVTRHLPVGKLVKIMTESGREVSATQSKSFLVWDHDEKKFVGKNGSEVRIGDIVPVSTFLERVREDTMLDLSSVFPKTEYLYTSELNKAKIIKEAKPRRWWKGHQGIDFILPYARPDSVFAHRKDFLENKVKDGLIYIYNTPKIVSHVPEKIPLTNDFGFLIGIFLAEGCCTETFTCISNNCPFVRKRITDWCDNYGITYHLVEKDVCRTTENGAEIKGKSSDLKLHSVLITRLLFKLCYPSDFKRGGKETMKGEGSSKKMVPNFAFFANKDFQKGLIDGYFSGDGCVNKIYGNIYVGSTSKELILGISFILSYFGIFGRVSGSQQKKNNIGSKKIRYMNTFNISNSYAKIFAKEITLTLPAKQEKLQTITLKKIYVYEKNYNFPQDRNVYFDKITSIDFVDSTKSTVYDFTISKTRNFSTFNALQVIDTFHSSGLTIKTVVVGVPRFSELLNATKDPKMKNCLIFLTEPMDGIPMIRKRIGNTFTDINIKRLVKTYELMKGPLEDWHHLFCNIYSINKIKLGWRLRFFLDISILYEYQIRMKLVKEKIEQFFPTMTVLYTPESKGIIDVFIDEFQNEDVVDEYEDIVDEDDDIVDEEEDVVDEEEIVEEDEDLEVEEDEIKIVDIKKKDIINDDELLEIPFEVEQMIKIEDQILPQLLNINISGISNIKEIFFEKRKLENSEEWVITTEGSNLYGLFSNPLVDKKRTLCNDMWEIYSVFGIEATRQFLIEEFMDVVSSDGTFVNSSHIELLVDMMVYTGSIISISRYGQKKVGSGPMSKASFEESLENFLKAGLNGEKETTDGVSASIMLGKLPKTGTGVFDLKINIDGMINMLKNKEDKENDKLKNVSANIVLPNPSSPSSLTSPSRSSPSIFKSNDVIERNPDEMILQKQSLPSKKKFNKTNSMF